MIVYENSTPRENVFIKAVQRVFYKISFCLSISIITLEDIGSMLYHHFLKVAPMWLRVQALAQKMSTTAKSVDHPIHCLLYP
jgi:hypothetical protein